MSIPFNLPRHLLESASEREFERLAVRLRKADLRLERDGTVVSGRGAIKRSIVAHPLQDKSGQLRPDAREILVRGRGLTGENDARQIIDARMRVEYPIILGNKSFLHGIWIRLLTELDPIPALTELVESVPNIRLFRVRPTAKLLYRDFVWKLLTEAVESNVSFVEWRERGPRIERDYAVQGFAALNPALFLSAPLVARNQPLAVVFTTARYAHIIGTLPGSGGIRYQNVGSWPSGTSGVSLWGTGKGIYRTRFKEFGPGTAEAVFDAVLKGANDLLEYLTDPTNWVESDNTIDTVERNLAWSTILYGLDAMQEIGDAWTEESIWTSFRALGILSGYWGREEITPLLDPSNIRDAAVATFPVKEHREWALDIVANYESEVLKVGDGGDLKSGIGKIEHVRHLIHGTALSKKQRRNERVEALRSISRQSVNLRLLRDVATFWWSSLLFAPATNARFGRPPF